VQRYASSLASAGLAAAFAAVAFGARGGNELGRTTVVELALILVGGLAIATSLAYGPRVRHGRGAMWIFVILTAVTTCSVFWSIAPDLSWVEANRTIAYLAMFTAGVSAARLAPQGAAAVLRGILGGAAIVVGYALASRVFPESLGGPTELYARIGQPFQYWNAVGATAALAVPGALWLGARRSGHQPANALGYPLLGLLLLALFLSYSRGAMAMAAIGVIVWMIAVPLRLRSLTVLVVSTAGAAPVIAWALSHDAFTKDGLTPAARAAVGPEFGLLTLVMCGLLLAAGLAIGFRGRGRSPSFGVRRRAGVAAVAVAVAVPLVLLTSVAFSDRGLPGTVSDRFSELTSETAKTPGGPQRLVRASSTRGRYYRQAAHIFRDHPVLGTGAGTFGVARLQYRKDQLVVRHAHGFVAQTLSDLGLLGLAAALAFAGAWFLGAARTTGLDREARRREGATREWDGDRVAIAALALTAVVFGLHSAIDWTWFVPGPAVMGIVAAGFAGGRGPVPPPVLPVMAATPAHRRRLGLPPIPRERLLPAVLALVAALISAWAVLQPERSEQKSREALALAAERKPAEAARAAEDAGRINPLSVRPLFVRAQIAYLDGKADLARGLLEKAVLDQPSNPEAWTRLAEFQLYRLNQPADALTTIAGALYLDPRSRPAQAVFFDARSKQRAAGTTP
jgi:hypothetical protein